MIIRTKFPRLLALATLAIAGCGKDKAEPNASTQEVAVNATAVAAEIPNACTFFAKAELESAIGAELRDGEPQAVPDASESICRFRKQLGSRATKSFSDPVLPTTLGFNSLTVATSPADPQAVAEIRKLDPAAFEDVRGIGDDAYYLGPTLLHVRVGQRSFSLRIGPEPQSPKDQAAARQVIQALGKAGASRL